MFFGCEEGVGGGGWRMGEDGGQELGETGKGEGRNRRG